MALENRSLERGLMVLEALARQRSMSLADLARATGLPKSTLRRLLGTLVARRAVRRSLSDGLYRSNVVMPMGMGQSVPDEVAGMVDLAMPPLLDLTRSVGWPSDFHVRGETRMRIVDSTRTASPFHVYQGRVNRDVNIFGAASGAAVLSQLPPEHVREIARRVAGDARWGLERFGLSVDDYLAVLEETRARGWGTRLGNYLGETVLDDGLSGIAVAIRRGEEVAGAVTLLWPRSFAPVERFAADHAPDLAAAAAAVSGALSAEAGEAGGVTA